MWGWCEEKSNTREDDGKEEVRTKIPTDNGEYPPNDTETQSGLNETPTGEGGQG
jgi:hypothetical protein